ncbi:Glutathione-dependent formaldehyde-activating enzyme/centromere protein V [Penicillium tannophilum]|nr:Glutathione-dependent formaldehyde-activating enzyme/centromere protein V [Penicillium tannophilum]
MGHEPLHGSCSCGRNEYQIIIPDDVTDHASVYFDSSRDNRRFHGTPLSAWLRVPLDWYQSHTTSFYPDETHEAIRRIFTPHHAPQTQRIFCGFCGTPLTFWTEEPAEEADFMSIAIGSLFGDDQHALEDLNLLPEDFDEDAQHADILTSSAPSALTSSREDTSVIVPSFSDSPAISRSFRHGKIDGIPWFEEMVEGSRLGRLMRAKRGKGISDDNSTTFEWEISEWHDDGTRGIAQEESDSSDKATGKRKRGNQGDAQPRSKRA